MEQNREPQDSDALMLNLYMTMEARIYNGERTASSTSGAGKTGQLHIK